MNGKIREFARQLEEIVKRDNLKVGLDASGQIRVRISSERFCPLTAVCLIETGVHLNVSGYHHAGSRLGLTLNEIDTIVFSADNNRGAAFFNDDVRELLLRSCFPFS